MQSTPILNIDISSVGIEGASGLLIQELEKMGLDYKYFLYVGMEGNDIREVLETGSLRRKIIGTNDAITSDLIWLGLVDAKPEDYIFASTEESLRIPVYRKEKLNPLDWAGRYSPSERRTVDLAIAIYEKIGLTSGINSHGFRYLNRIRRFLDPDRKLDALVSIVRFIDEEKVL